MDKVRIAIAGLGRTGTPLLEYLLTRPWAEIVGVADGNENGRGMKVAREHNIFCTPDADVLAAKGREIDVIIEVTGDPAVKPMLRDAFIAQGNRETVICHDVIARMLLSIVNDTDELVETFHPGDKGIG
jgi:predicted dehydrogenase